jgi:transcriptional regulator with XRE-family HTH domain
MSNQNINGHLAENIQFLRKANGETQTELSKCLNFQKSTIGMYESGKRIPDSQTLHAIAQHYGVTVDELLNSDFSKLKYLSYSVNNSSDFTELIGRLLPLVTSDTALNNKYFKKGFECLNKMRTDYENDITITESQFEECCNAFQLSADIDNLPEGIANLIWLLFVFCFGYLVGNMHNVQNIIFGSGQNFGSINKALLKDRNSIDAQSVIEKNEFVNGMDENILEMLRLLKETKLSALADYYLALRYVLTMVNTGLSDEMNKTIGLQMMLSLASMRNSYAIAFLQAIRLINKN